MTLKIYADAIQLIRELQKVIVEIARHDADLGKQMKGALTSIALNIAEGESRRDGHGRARFATAMGSANEVRACLEVADPLGTWTRMRRSGTGSIGSPGRCSN